MSASVRKRPEPAPAAGTPPALADRADRDLARLSLDRNVVVEAGAGTGKTTLLADRALFLLLGAGVPIAEIVALTFTEKAAGEIRVRLSDRLVELLEFWRDGGGGLEGGRSAAPLRCAALAEELRARFKAGPELAARRARAALEDMDKAVIGTLHSFAARLLRAYPLQAGVDPEFQVDAGESFEELFASEWASWLDLELAEGAPREREWIGVLRLVELEELEALARALCGARFDPASASSTPPDLLAWLRETLAVVEAEPGRQPPAARGKMPERLQQTAARLRSLLQAGASAEAPASLPDTEIPRADWPKGWSPENAERCEAGRLVASRVSPEGDALIRAAAALVSPFCGGFREAFRRRGRISFDGLLVAARDLVRDNGDAREELKGKWRAFLVDEFQDTDPLQGELLFYLAEKAGRRAKDWREAELEAGKLFVVGDPKQSIYRFRGADLGAYERFVGRMREQSAPALFCALTVNFRSHAGILEPVNAIFSRMMAYREGSQPAYRPIVPAAGRAEVPAFVLDPVAGVEWVVVSSDAEDAARADVGRTRRAEARWIADWLEEHRDNPYPLKSIAVLLRTATPLEAYIDAFKERGIPYVVEAEKYFYGTQEVLDFLNLLRALDDPSDRIALAGLLRSPLAAIADAELAALARAGGLDYLRGPGSRTVSRIPEAARRLYAALRELRGAVGREPLSDLVRRIGDRTQLLGALFAAYHGEQTLSNLLKFARMAAEASDARGLTLKGFIRRVERSIAESREEGESPLADEHLDAVRLLTIHKAKGLEYPVVLVPNLAGAASGGGERPVLRMDWIGGGAGLSLPATAVGTAAAILERREALREEDEAVRLLYVAMTRAKERLILLGAEAGRSGSFARRLAEIGAWPECPGVRVRRVAVGAPEARAGAARRGSGAPVPAGLADAERFARGWRRRAERRDVLSALPRHASPTDAEAGRREPIAAARESPEARRFAFPPSALVGRICHAALEAWDWSRDASAPRVAAAVEEACRAARRRAPGADWAGAAAESREILAGFLASPAARILRGSEILGRELPFLRGEDGAVVRGTIDVLFRRDGRLWVADYKTDRVSGKDARAAARRYAGQATAYAEAVRRALGVRDVGLLILFLRTGTAVEL